MLSVKGEDIVECARLGVRISDLRLASAAAIQQLVGMPDASVAIALSPHRRARILHARAVAGGTPTDIARRAQSPVRVVRAVLAELADAAIGRGRLSTISPREQEHVVQAYVSGATLEALVRTSGWSRSTVYRILDAYMVPRRGSRVGAEHGSRTRRGQHPDSTRARCLAAYRRGEALASITARANVSRSTLMRWVDHAHLPRRQPPRNIVPVPANVARQIARAYPATSMAVLCARYARYRMTAARIRAIVRAHDVPFKQSTRTSDPPSLVRAVAAAATRGATHRELRCRFKLGARRLARILAGTGLKLRGLRQGERPWTDAKRRRLLRLHRAGVPLRTLRHTFHARHNVLQRELARATQEARPAAMTRPRAPAPRDGRAMRR